MRIAASNLWRQLRSPTTKRLAPGTDAYEQHLSGEIAHYNERFNTDSARASLLTDVPSSFQEIHIRASAIVREQTGHDWFEHTVELLNRRPGTRLLSLGCGAGGNEIELAKHAPRSEFVCLDVNETLLAMGRERARELGLSMTFETADLNTDQLPRREADVVLCIAALHHLVELEHVAEQIIRALRPDGRFVTVDIVTDNGFRMWPETVAVVRPLFRTLPSRFRVNHTAYADSRVDEEIWEADTSEASMECIRSADILRVLDASFSVVHLVPYFSISLRLLDTMYGPNYDLSQPLDLALLNWIWELDRHYLTAGVLRPETFVGVYAPG